jgi:HSP20 family protein
MHQWAPSEFGQQRQGQQRSSRELATGQHWLAMRTSNPWRPPTDVYETDEYLVVKVEIAGMGEDDFDISLQRRDLIITGHRRDPSDKLAYQQMEIHYGDFETSVRLPWPVDVPSVEATYQQGFLNIVLPKAQPRRVPVINAAEADS